MELAVNPTRVANSVDLRSLSTSLSPSPSFSHSFPRRERGIVLIIALIVMVAMSLAGLALIRSVDTTTTIIGNLGLRQASIPPGNVAVEAAAAALFNNAAPGGIRTIANLDNDFSAENYFASRQAGEDARGIPVVLQSISNFTLPKSIDDQAGNQVRYVIERLCDQLGAPDKQHCELMPPKNSYGTTVNDPPLVTGALIPIYRLTVRIDGPKNTTSFLQAMLR